MNTISYMQKATEVAAANGEIVKSMFDTSVATMQRLMTLNGDFVRSISRDAYGGAREVDVGERIGAYLRRLDDTEAYLCELNELCIRTHTEFARMGAQRAGEVLKALVAQFEQAGRANPLEAGGFRDMVKAGFDSTGAAYEEMIKTMRAVTESNLTAAMQSLRAQTHAHAHAQAQTQQAKEPGKSAAQARKAA